MSAYAWVEVVKINHKRISPGLERQLALQFVDENPDHWVFAWWQPESKDDYGEFPERCIVMHDKRPPDPDWNYKVRKEDNFTVAGKHWPEEGWKCLVIQTGEDPRGELSGAGLGMVTLSPKERERLHAESSQALPHLCKGWKGRQEGI